MSYIVEIWVHELGEWAVYDRLPTSGGSAAVDSLVTKLRRDGFTVQVRRG